MCEKCKEKTIKYIGIKCSDEELSSLKLIMDKFNCIQQIINVDSIPDYIVRRIEELEKIKDEQSIGELNILNKKIKLFIANSIDKKAETQWLERDWWKTMIEKYMLPSEKTNVYIDFNSGEFYTLE